MGRLAPGTVFNAAITTQVVFNSLLAKAVARTLEPPTMIPFRLRQPLAMLCLLLSGIALADPAWQTPPANPVILTVSGELDCCPEGNAYFDLARLDALAQTEVKTLTPWTDSVDSYTGVRMSELLAALGAKGDKLEAVALNDYSNQFNSEAALQYPVILATRKNGQPMRIRDKGPIWIIYPLSDYPQLRKEESHHAMVWQLKSLKVAR